MDNAMSWIKDDCVNFFEYFMMRVIKTGRVPKHLAIIMDGNRRYAKKNQVKTDKGHAKGFDKLSETLRWCLNLNIREVTVYAFSIENFKRSEEEVKNLMDLARQKFQRLLDDLDLINSWGVRIHVAGRLTLLPKDLRKLISKSMLATKNNNKLRLNIAYAYTARDEITRAASHIIDTIEEKQLLVDDINETVMSQTLDLSEPDLLIRTSGEVRLSDFMLWQLSDTVLYFSNVLWPDFSVWNLLAAVLHFQRYAPLPTEQKLSEKQEMYLENLEMKRLHQLEQFVAES